MRSSAKVCSLRNDRISSNLNRGKRVEFSVVSNPRVIANGYIPWKGNAHGGPDENTAPDVRSEKPPQESSPAVHELRRGPKKPVLRDPPKLNNPFGPAAKLFGDRETRKVDVAGWWGGLRACQFQFPFMLLGIRFRRRHRDNMSVR